MKLSMWVLADWLIGYDATVMITDGPMMLEGVRLLSGAHSDDRRIVYLDYAAISDISSRPGIFCVHGRDLIFLKTDDIDSVLNDILAAFDFFDSWENDIRRLIHEEGTLQDILDYSNGVFLQPMLLLDPDDEIVASIGQADHDDRLETWRRLEHGSALDEVAVTDEACASDVREASGEDDAPYNGRSRVSGILQ